MRITAVHSYYASSSSSGENVAVDVQAQALADGGHDIDIFGRSTDEMQSKIGYRLASSVRVASGLDTRGGVLPVATNYEHVLLVHNLFPNFGTRWISHWPGPVVTMLHNFRYLCANGLLLRNGRMCTECIGMSTFPAIRYSCYRDSRLATLPLAIANRNASRSVTPLSRADTVIAQSERARVLYEAAGVDRLTLVPGFGPNAVDYVNERARTGWAFVGRISNEKGLLELLRIWPEGESLDVIGDGSERLEAERHAPAGVHFVGALPYEEVLHRLRGYKGLVFPGICAEGAHPMVVREAFAVATPVVAAQGSSAADAVKVLGGGVTYDPKDTHSLLSALERVSMNADLGRQARNTAATYFSVHRWQEEMDRVLVSAQDYRRRRHR